MKNTRTVWLVGPADTPAATLATHDLIGSEEEAHTLAYDNGLAVFTTQVVIDSEQITRAE